MWAGSIVFVWFVETHGLGSVDDEVRCVNVVTLHDHLENLGLVHCTLFHEVNDLILYCDCVINIVVQLDLQLILQLSILLQEVLIINGISKVLIILRQQVHLAIVGP